MALKHDIDRYVSWAEANLPLLRARGTAEVRRVVRKALGDFGPTRAAISVAGVTAGVLAGFILTDVLSGGDLPVGYQMAAAAFGGAIIAYAVEEYSDRQVKRRIESIATGYSVD